MEEKNYSNLIINNEFEKLANISNINDLVKYQYLHRYLIEYLLERRIHTKMMDAIALVKKEWTYFYLKYDIIKPLIRCNLNTLLQTYNNELLLDILLKKLNHDERIKLLHNLKHDSYWDFHNNEEKIANIYLNYGITFPKVFIDKPVINKTNLLFSKNDTKLIDEFKKVFCDCDKLTISFYITEFKRGMKNDKEKVLHDIKDLIQYKQKNPNFKLLISNNTEGEYNPIQKQIVISPYRHNIFYHEFSHLRYDDIDINNKDDILIHYKNIQNKIDESHIVKITNYLNNFHHNYEQMKKYFSEIYYHEIKKKYGSYNEYIKVICRDIEDNYPEMIMVDDRLISFYPDYNKLEDTVVELLSLEKEEYVNNLTRNFYSEELILENLLDALLMGKIYDGFFDIISLSGHSGFDFIESDDLSFNECLANYEAIKKSSKAERLINDLTNLVGYELIYFLENYIAINRSLSNKK